MPDPTALPLPEPNASAPTAPLQRLRNAALLCTLALIVLCLAWELWLLPIGRGTLALKSLPLLLALPGLWRYRLYTSRWLSLAVWLYVAEGAVRATSEPGLGAALAAAELLLALLLFVLCAAQVRLRIAAGRAAGTVPPKAVRAR
ncbi:MAG: hypothetical protein RJA44_161 [Pseudomonadota bacterium]